MDEQEILGLGVLDALGLLDEGQRKTFDRAFQLAPLKLRTQVRRQQSMITADDLLISAISAPSCLQDRAWNALLNADIQRAGENGMHRRRSMQMLHHRAGSKTISRGWQIASSLKVEHLVDGSLDLMALAIPRCHRDEIVGDFRDALTKARARGWLAYWFVLILKLWVTIRAAIGIRFADLVPSRKNTQA